jgi:AdoMet-dependent rRNA methyltransferase SPB1
MPASSQVTPKVNDAVENTKVTDDDVLLQEMEELTSAIDSRKKNREKAFVKASGKGIMKYIYNFCNMMLI